jgi:dipeptidyl aminopeptidase/acylaminoacyl peptidase
MKTPLRVVLVVVTAILVPALPATAQEPAPASSQTPLPTSSQAPSQDGVFSVARYLDYETVADPKLSPDGSQIIYTRRWVNRQEDRWESALWIMDSDGSRARFLTRGSNAAWSPDGRRIAYLADGEPKGTQVWVRWLDAAGAATQVTRVEHAPANIRWSPDGSMIGFSSFVPHTATWKVELPAMPEGAKWTEAPRVVDRLHYRQERRGFSRPGHTHLFVVPADAGTPRQLTKGEWNVGFRFDALEGGVAWDWTPDGRTIITEGFNDPAGDQNYRDSNLYAVDVATGSVRRLTPERGTWRTPAVSPDGRRIAFAGNPFSTKSYQAADLYVMNVDGSGARRISGELDRDPGDLTWAADGSGVYFTADDRGSRNVLFASASGGVRPVTEGVHMLTNLDAVRNGAAVVRSAPQSPGDVHRLDLRRGTLTRVTAVNDDILTGMRLGEVEELWYDSPDGTRVQGWIVKPPHFDANRTYPLIMEIHGGPHAMYNVAFNPMFQNFAANDHVVLYTNPRGSTGYGTDFGNAIARAYPSVDYDDLMAGIDAVVARGYIDEKRMYVGGCSGGGVLSSWVIAHTDRFAAAAVRCPVTNWLSMAGTTDVPLFTFHWFERPFWEDPQPWLHHSPLMHVGKVNTPVLLMTGELDLRTPMAQSEEYFVALRMRGVPTTLLRFAGEYHGTGSIPSNWMRTQQYMLDWYGRWDTESARRAVAAGQD